MLAIDGSDAVMKFTSNPNKIDLLILDSVMPRKNGRLAYEEMKKISPDIRSFSPVDIHRTLSLIKASLKVRWILSPNPYPPWNCLKKCVRSLTGTGKAKGEKLRS